MDVYNYKSYANLSDEEITDLITNALNNEDEEEQEMLLTHIALFTNGEVLSNFYTQLVDKEIFYPGEIYLHANEQIADLLIQRISNDNNLSNNHILCALAWIGTPNVVSFFIESTNEKPDWTEKLYITPKEYATTGGWYIDDSGKKQALISKNVTVLSPNQEKSENNKIKTFIGKGENCPFCKNELSSFIKLPINEKETELTICPICSCYHPVYMTIDNTGKSHWHSQNQKWKHLGDGYEFDPIEENTLTVTNEQRKAENTISQFVGISKSQIGGYPTWIQDAEFLNCPECNSKMKFIAQIDMEDVMEYGEGIYYFHYCEKCDISGCNYQQS
jgi:uncharacterized protein with PIN domain